MSAGWDNDKSTENVWDVAEPSLECQLSPWHTGHHSMPLSIPQVKPAGTWDIVLLTHE